jgi:hypothetical protein
LINTQARLCAETLLLLLNNKIVLLNKCTNNTVELVFPTFKTQIAFLSFPKINIKVKEIKLLHAEKAFTVASRKFNFKN